MSRYDHIPEVKPKSKLVVREMLREDCVTEEYRAYEDERNGGIFVAGVNSEGQVCPEDIHSGDPERPGRGYAGSELCWKLANGREICLEGPSRVAPSYLSEYSELDEGDIRPIPFSVNLFLRDPLPRGERLGARWYKKRYVHTDRGRLRYKGRDAGAEELMRNFLREHPEVGEICHETLRTYGGGGGCFTRDNLLGRLED
jgi:hypothetical protein